MELNKVGRNPFRSENRIDASRLVIFERSSLDKPSYLDEYQWPSRMKHRKPSTTKVAGIWAQIDSPDPSQLEDSTLKRSC